MAKMNVSARQFTQAIMASVITEGGQKFVCPEQLAANSGLKLASAKLRFSQWTAKYKKAEKPLPWPPMKTEGRGAKKLNLDELAALAAEFAP